MDLEPVAGAALIRVTAASVFDLPCATNTDRDRERAVRFAVPRGYGGFRSRVVSSGIRDIARLDVRGDNKTLTSVPFTPGQSEVDVSTAVAGHAVLELRITCARPGGAVTFFNAALTR